VEPLTPENTLWILNGPLAGTGFPGSSRFTVCARSPLTGLWGESAVGENFGPVLRQAGWDGIELAGAAPTPAILVIDGERAELRDGSAFWGRDVYQCTRALKEELGAEFRIFCIGPAGENRVRFAARYALVAEAMGLRRAGWSDEEAALSDGSIVYNPRPADAASLTELLEAAW
jgi:aldehyde:ferredoxin oxidoreductase